MPLIRVITNTKLADRETQEKLMLSLSSSTSEILGKPESYVMVHLEQNQPLLFGGIREPACLIELKSLGLPEDKTEELTRRLCDLSEIHLNVPASRTYVEFTNPPRHMWGFDGHTFER